MSDCERWLRETLPLEPAVLGQAVHEARRRAAELGVDETTMAARLRDDRLETERLLQLVVPPETWLFRHAAAFELLRDALGARAGARVRVLSLGCARGAEPFSVAAAAASLGRTAADTEIVGVDWCSDNLREAAENACAPLAQRAPLPGWAARWFAPDGYGALRLHATPAAMLRWMHADILRDELPGPAEVVLCRNVAIYLDEPGRARLARRLERLVASDGLLLVGHADPPAIWNGAFEGTGPAAAFAFRPRTVGGSRATRSPDPAPPRRTPAAAPSVAPVARESVAFAATPEPSASLARARELADEGRLDDSAHMLDRLLASEPMCADGWSILGAVRLAQQRAYDAEACFRKVVYLQPMHALSLLQLSALAGARGDQASADRLRLRAARAASGLPE